MSTPNYWDMPDAELAAAYTAAMIGCLDVNPNIASANEEIVSFCEDAIMQRIGAPDDADPSVSEEWLAELEEYVQRWTVTA